MVKYKAETVRAVGGKAVRETWKVDTGKEPTKTERKAEKKKKKAKKSKWKRAFRSKPILKKQRVTVRIKEHKPAAYIPIHMKDVIKEDKRQFFFK
jgi:hypothetical protein